MDFCMVFSGLETIIEGLTELRLVLEQDEMGVDSKLEMFPENLQVLPGLTY